LTTKIRIGVNRMALPIRSNSTFGGRPYYLGFDFVIEDALPEPCVLLATRYNTTPRSFISIWSLTTWPFCTHRLAEKIATAKHGTGLYLDPMTAISIAEYRQTRTA
jgi:hypothetical protein